ncbi:MAG: hypothetical protein ACLFUU_08720 [Desulfobacteraceae bacterium]
MRQYLLDEISKTDIPRIKTYLDEHALPARLEGIWWVDLQDDLLNEMQYAHRQYQPFCFAIELGDKFVKFEFLIRSRMYMRCPCTGYANRQQRDFIMRFADRLVEELGLRT